MNAGETPFYERTLDSFADEIITESRRGSNGLWYAVLDVGPKAHVSDPDFSTCGKTRIEAAQQCARRIRNDSMGIGKYAPHRLLVPNSYDLRWRLMKHWHAKELTEQ